MTALAPLAAAPSNGSAGSVVDTGVRGLEIAQTIAGDELRADFCGLCGRPLPPHPGTRGKRRKFHPECGRFWWALNVVEGTLKAVKFASDAHRRAVRSRLVKIANKLPVPRDARGRFRAGG